MLIRINVSPLSLLYQFPNPVATLGPSPKCRAGPRWEANHGRVDKKSNEAELAIVLLFPQYAQIGEEARIN